MRVFTWFTNFWAKHLTPQVAYRGEDVAEKLGSKLVLINTSLLASPAHIRENCIRENCIRENCLQI